MTIRRHLVLLTAILLAGAGLAAERIPPAPARYFNDYAGVVSPPVANRLDAQLKQFERESSNQLLVVLYPKMESDSSVEDYTVRVAQAWKAGLAEKSNGAVLFAFMAEHKLYLQVGYGLESVLPDAMAKRIIEREIVPRFRAHDVDGGMTAAVNAMIAAAKGEYLGTGRTVAEGRQSNTISPGALLGLTFLIWVAFLFARRRFNRPSVFMNPRRNVITNTGWTGGGGGSWGGGGGSGGGGFSGGGGSFGGGGAGGSW